MFNDETDDRRTPETVQQLINYYIETQGGRKHNGLWMVGIDLAK